MVGNVGLWPAKTFVWRRTQDLRNGGPLENAFNSKTHMKIKVPLHQFSNLTFQLLIHIIYADWQLTFVHTPIQAVQLVCASWKNSLVIIIMTQFAAYHSYPQSITSKHLNIFFISPLSFRKSVILRIRNYDSRPLSSCIILVGSITSEHLNLFFISPSFRKSVILRIRDYDSRPVPPCIILVWGAVQRAWCKIYMTRVVFISDKETSSGQCQ